MLTAILIVNYNSASELLEVAAQLEKEVKLPQNFAKKLYILENGSTKAGEWETLQKLKEFPDVNLFISEKNLGFAHGNNFLLEKAKADNPDYFLFLNPDTLVDKNFLIELLKPMDSIASLQNDIGLASPKIYFAKGFETHPERYAKSDLGRVIWYAGGIIDWNNVVGYHKDVDEVDETIEDRKWKMDTEDGRLTVETDFCTGCCLLATKKALEKLGGFDENYFLNLEDLDLSLRAQRAGFKTVYVPGAIIWHKNAVSKGGTGSKIEDYYQTRSRLIFAFRYASLKVKVLLLWQLLRTADLNRLKAICSAGFIFWKL